MKRLISVVSIAVGVGQSESNWEVMPTVVEPVSQDTRSKNKLTPLKEQSPRPLVDLINYQEREPPVLKVPIDLMGKDKCRAIKPPRNFNTPVTSNQLSVLLNNASSISVLNRIGRSSPQLALQDSLLKELLSVHDLQHTLSLHAIDENLRHYRGTATILDLPRFEKIDKSHTRNVIMIGPPGSGKGTHGPKIRDRLDLCHLATGDMLREAIEKRSEIGLIAEAIMKRGELVPDEVVISLIESKINDIECHNGLLLDGFPRTRAQAEKLDILFSERNMTLDNVLEFKVDEQVLLERIEGRRIHMPSGRSYHLKFNPPEKDGLDNETGEPLIHRKDDTREALVKRMESYNSATSPILDFYRERAILKTLEATAAIEEVAQQIDTFLQ